MDANRLTRVAIPGDIPAIHKVHLHAFDESERERVAQLACDLTQALDDSTLLALVAEVDGAIVGHIAFTRVSCADHPHWTGFMLSPLGVIPDHQRTGIGSELVKTGIEQLCARKVDTLFVYGDPAYYGRFGFEVATIGQYKTPFDLQYPHGWQALELNTADKRIAPIALQCVELFLDERLW